MVTITISVTPSGEASEPARILSNDFDSQFASWLDGHRFATTLSGIVVFPTIISPRVGAIPAAVTHKRGENSIFMSVNLSYDEFVAGDERTNPRFVGGVMIADLPVRATRGDERSVLGAWNAGGAAIMVPVPVRQQKGGKRLASPRNAPAQFGPIFHPEAAIDEDDMIGGLDEVTLALPFA